MIPFLSNEKNKHICRDISRLVVGIKKGEKGMAVTFNRYGFTFGVMKILWNW